MPENTTTTKNKPQKRTNYLTEGRIKKEKAKLSEMFAGIEDEDRRTLVNSVIDEAAFLKVALLQAKTELKKEGLTTETKNASQKFIKAHPSTAIYEKYARQYARLAAEERDEMVLRRLLSRGYSYDDARAALREATGEMDT